MFVRKSVQEELCFEMEKNNNTDTVLVLWIYSLYLYCSYKVLDVLYSIDFQCNYLVTDISSLSDFSRLFVVMCPVNLFHDLWVFRM